MKKYYFTKWLLDLCLRVHISCTSIVFSFLFIHIILITRYQIGIILPRYGFVITTEERYYIDDPKCGAYIWKRQIGKIKFLIGKFYGRNWDVVD